MLLLAEAVVSGEWLVAGGCGMYSHWAWAWCGAEGRRGKAQEQRSAALQDRLEAFRPEANPRAYLQ